MTNETLEFLEQVKDDKMFRMSARYCFSGQELRHKMESYVKTSLPLNHAMASLMQKACLDKLEMIDFDYIFENLHKSED